MRYTTRRPERMYWDDDAPLILNHLNVDEASYTPTGILTADGDMIYHMPNPIGFGRDEEW
jgi:hypothetical protein